MRKRITQFSRISGSQNGIVPVLPALSHWPHRTSRSNHSLPINGAEAERLANSLPFGSEPNPEQGANRWPNREPSPALFAASAIQVLGVPLAVRGPSGWLIQGGGE